MNPSEAQRLGRVEGKLDNIELAVERIAEAMALLVRIDERQAAQAETLKSLADRIASLENDLRPIKISYRWVISSVGIALTALVTALANKIFP